MHISNIADIMTGYPFRKRIENDPNGRFAVIQMRDVENYTHLMTENLARVSAIDPKERHFIRQNDLLFSAKGANNFAVQVEQLPVDTVAAANFLVIRVRSDKVLPAYLAWYINQSPAQLFLQARSRGSYIPAISKMALSDLDIPLPSLALQRKIVSIQSLASSPNTYVHCCNITAYSPNATRTCPGSRSGSTPSWSTCPTRFASPFNTSRPGTTCAASAPRQQLAQRLAGPFTRLNRRSPKR